MTPTTRDLSIPAGFDPATVDDAAYRYTQQLTDAVSEVIRRRLRDDLVRQALPFAARLARRYRGRGEPLEDLEQVARLALVRSVDRYDATRGPFTAYAAATIIGELRRHFRDTTWVVHVPRRMQELSLEVGRAAGELTAELARAPTVDELVRRTGASDADVREAIETAAAYVPASLNAPIGGGATELGDLLGAPDSAIGAVDDRVTVAALVDGLPARERELLALRFYANRTQAQIAAELGISQMHVSRLLTRALSWLREAMLSDVPPRWEGAGADTAADVPAVRVTLTRDAGVLTLRLLGEIDRDAAERVRRRIRGAITRAAADGDRVQVDLTAVPLVDAAGVAILLDVATAAQNAGVRLSLTGAQQYVAHILAVSGLRSLLG